MYKHLIVLHNKIGYILRGILCFAVQYGICRTKENRIGRVESSLYPLRIFFWRWGYWTPSVIQANRVNTLRPRQNGRHFADDIFKCIFLNENVWIPAKISMKFVPKGPINNIPALVQIMAWRRPGDKPLSEPMMVSLTTHICVTRPQWVNLRFEYLHLRIWHVHSTLNRIGRKFNQRLLISIMVHVLFNPIFNLHICLFSSIWHSWVRKYPMYAKNILWRLDSLLHPTVCVNVAI